MAPNPLSCKRYTAPLKVKTNDSQGYINDALFPGGKSTCRDVDDVENSLHLRHCIEYISKAILCAADTTLERATVTELEDGRHSYFVGEASAWETSHECRSLAPVNDLVAKYSVSRYARYVEHQ